MLLLLKVNIVPLLCTTRGSKSVTVTRRSNLTAEVGVPFPFWQDDLIYPDSGGPMGCNVYAAPPQLKTPYSIKYKLKLP